MKEMQHFTTHTLIIGAGPAGLAVAACLTKQNIPFILLERSDAVGSKWRQHYKRLHLHTAKEFSSLPYFNFPKQYPRYPSRQQVVRYLEDYADHFNIQPQFHTTVTDIQPLNREWQIEAIQQQKPCHYLAKNVVIATGYNNVPFTPQWQGLETFQGQVLHSADYQDGKAFKDKSVMVIGFGNSGAEIALDLWEYGAKPIMSVRSPVNVLPKEIFGIPTLALGIVQQHLPTKMADRTSKITSRLLMGDLSKYGLQTLERGPMQEIKENGRVPMLDIGTIDLIKQGQIKVYGDIDYFEKDRVIFKDGRYAKIDAVVTATGYRPRLDQILTVPDVLDNGKPSNRSVKSTMKGLYFCGFYISPAGMFREIAHEAKQIAEDIKAAS